MEYRLKLIDLHTLETWSLRLHVESKITPRFLGGSSLGLISWSPTLIMDYESYFFVFWQMQLYMSWYIRSFFGFTFLNILYFFNTLVLTSSYRRSLYTFYSMEICKDWLVQGRDVITNSSVLSSFSFNKFNFIHARISSTHFSRREMLLTMDEGSEGLNA